VIQTPARCFINALEIVDININDTDSIKAKFVLMINKKDGDTKSCGSGTVAVGWSKEVIEAAALLTQAIERDLVSQIFETNTAAITVEEPEQDVLPGL